MNKEEFPHQSKIGFVEINGRKEQIAIGQITETKDSVEVKVLGGCSKIALEDEMHKIADRTGKTVRATHQNELVVIEPQA